MNKLMLLALFVAGIPALASPPYAYVVNVPVDYLANPTADHGKVSVVDFKTAKVVATITVGVWPAGIAANPTGKFLYVSNSYDGTISVIDATMNQVVHTVKLAGSSNPGSMVVTPDGKSLYVAVANGIAVISTATYKTLVKFNPLPASDSEILSVLMSPDGKFLYVLTGGDPAGIHVQKIATSNKAVVASLFIAAFAIHYPIPQSGLNLGGDDFALTRDGSTLYVETSQSPTDYTKPFELVQISTASLEQINTFTLREHFMGLAEAPDRKHVYLTSLHPDFSVLDADTGKEVSHAYLPFGGGSIAVTPNGRYVLVLGDVTQSFGFADHSGDAGLSVVCGITHHTIGEVFPLPNPTRAVFLPMMEDELEDGGSEFPQQSAACVEKATED